MEKIPHLEETTPEGECKIIPTFPREILALVPHYLDSLGNLRQGLPPRSRAALWKAVEIESALQHCKHSVTEQKEGFEQFIFIIERLHAALILRTKSGVRAYGLDASKATPDAIDDERIKHLARMKLALYVSSSSRRYIEAKEVDDFHCIHNGIVVSKEEAFTKETSDAARAFAEKYPQLPTHLSSLFELPLSKEKEKQKESIFEAFKTAVRAWSKLTGRPRKGELSRWDAMMNLAVDLEIPPASAAMYQAEWREFSKENQIGSDE